MNAVSPADIEYSMIRFTGACRHKITGTDLSVRFRRLGGMVRAEIFRGRQWLAISDPYAQSDLRSAFYSAALRLNTWNPQTGAYSAK
jgi:hypothetical protein